jgi:hypothetical protein
VKLAYASHKPGLKSPNPKTLMMTKTHAIDHETRRIALAALSMLALPFALAAGQAGASPVKIFILAGQSNMLGKGEISPVGTPGTLDYTVANDPGGKYQFLKSGGSYVVRDDDPNSASAT